MQRRAQTAYYAGKQQRLNFGEMSKEEEARQRKNAKERMKTVEKQHLTNFYALDTETSGFDFNYPVQIAVIRFENGAPVD